MTIRFVIDQKDISATNEENKLSAYDIETFERWNEGEQVPSYRIKKLAVKFMVDESGKPVPLAKALKIFDALPFSEYQETLAAFSEAMQNAAVPKGNGTPLNSPSARNTTTASPDGSSPLSQRKNGEHPPGNSPGNGSHPGGDLSGESVEISTQENI